jgi:predicted PurR-regulated permease PerM
VQRQIADPVHAPLLQRLPSGVRTVIAENAGKTGAAVAAIAASVGANALGILAGTTATLTDIVLTLILTLLIVSDLAQLQTFGTRLTPREWREPVLSFVREVDQVIGGFVRWQISVAFGVGILGTVILSLLDVPYALLVGLIAGILSIVPIIGPFVAIIPVLVISFFTVGLVKSLLVLLLFGAVIAVQQNVLPLINARTVGVTPLVIFVALLIGSEAFGIVGALLSIPIAGIVRVAVTRLLPPDPDADARIEAARDQAGEPEAETREAIEEP